MAAVGWNRPSSFENWWCLVHYDRQERSHWPQPWWWYIKPCQRWDLPQLPELLAPPAVYLLRWAGRFLFVLLLYVARYCFCCCVARRSLNFDARQQQLPRPLRRSMPLLYGTTNDKVLDRIWLPSLLAPAVSSSLKYLSISLLREKKSYAFENSILATKKDAKPKSNFEKSSAWHFQNDIWGRLTFFSDQTLYML